MSAQPEDNRLGTESIPRLMLRLGLPSVAAQVVFMLYNVVDRVFIGHIQAVGRDALTGVGVTFPLVMIIGAFAAFVGTGGAALAAIELGRGNTQKAERIMANGFLLLMCFAALLFVSLFTWKTDLLRLFGASERIMPYADGYISIILLGVAFTQLGLGLNPFISAQGFAGTAMCSVLIGAVVNILLDPLFIFGFGMGIKGAAIATVLSQMISACWIICFLLGKRTLVRLRLALARPDLSIITRMMALGLSPFVMQATESAIVIVFNSRLQVYGGDAHVGTMTILLSVMQMIFTPVSGFRYGVQPIIGYNFGAAKFDRTKKAISLTIAILSGYSFVCASLAMIFPAQLAAIFTDSAELIELTRRTLPVYICGMLLFGVQSGVQTSFVALGEAKRSLFLALLRKVFLLIPLAMTLPRFWGVFGIYWAEPLSDLTSATVSGLLMLLSYRKLISPEGLARI